MKQHPFERDRVGGGHERYALERRARRCAHHERGVFRLEADEPRAHRLIRSPGHVGVARANVDLVRARRLGAAGNDQKRGQPVPQVGGSQNDEQDRRRCHGRQRRQVTPDARALDRAPVIDGATLFDGLLDELFDELGRMRGIGFGRRFDGAQNRRLERRIALFQIQRDLRLRHAAEQRADEPIRGERGEHPDGTNPKRDDGIGAEPKGFQAPGRQQESHERAREHDNGAPQGETQPPAVADAANHVQERGATVLRHWGSSSHHEKITPDAALTEIFRDETTDWRSRFRPPK